MNAINRKISEINEITEALVRDDNDGNLLRPYTREKLENRLQLLREEVRELNNNIFSEN